MGILRNWAHAVSLGGFPLIAMIGFATYGLILVGVVLMIAKKWSRRLHRRAFKLHRWIGYTALVAATFHLLLGVSLYV